MEVRLSGHTAYKTEYHIVWITKYRYRVLNPGVKGYLEKLFPKVLKKLPGCEIVKYNIQPDHVHMVMIIPPKYSVSEVVGRIKGMTGSQIRKKFRWMKLRYSRENIVWSPGYFVSTVGLEREKILNYVEYQGRQDSGQAKLEM
jgi:putative transposase